MFLLREEAQHEVALFVGVKGRWYDDVLPGGEPMTGAHFTHVYVGGDRGNGGVGHVRVLCEILRTVCWGLIKHPPIIINV